MKAAVVAIAALAFTGLCVVTHHPIFGGLGICLTFMALARTKEDI